MIKKCLTEGIHVFVDKPVSENFAEVEELFALAKAKQKLLMVGFNRRFAPMVDQLKQIPDKRMIYLSKHRQAASHDTKYVIYDLFLHLVDTGVYLLDEPIIAHTSQIKRISGWIGDGHTDLGNSTYNGDFDDGSPRVVPIRKITGSPPKAEPMM